MKIIIGLFGLMLATSCNTASAPATSTTDTTTAAPTPAAMPAKAVSKFDAAMVDNKKDPSCGMPVKAGIEDTLHYKNKILGFCSKECKDAFLVKPDSFTVVLK
ncbi:YHS domain-containing protein [Chitinophaga costaii]|uniref:YHS domain-containing protein n=1 Tax=Chitinophaga costaii TaxID=1335309 RepID=A0A1C4DH47_9BACT|nr:YHS domain-containing protein [Chitinophaga costaii]PUZ24633.1 YHS domain-containing protein [Chitinophaga costaii]SCC30697.1 YHS domain-containing protein [Chitinophaga costaii]